MKNQARPFVLNAAYSGRKKKSSDSDSSDYEPIRLHEHMDDSPFYDQLLGGALPIRNEEEPPVNHEPPPVDAGITEKENTEELYSSIN